MGDAILSRIQHEVGSWNGVTVAPHRYGGIEFRVGRRELGHLHGSKLADLPFPVAVRKQLVVSGQAATHHVLPGSGWVSCWIHDESDLDSVINLFRLNYERPWLIRGNAMSSSGSHDHTPSEERRIREAALDETIAESFPASDPPSTLPNPDEHDAEGSGVEAEETPPAHPGQQR